MNIVLLGDSIFDNAVYLDEGQRDVIMHLGEQIPTDWSATLCAYDGDVAEGVADQLLELPDDATHLFVSVGGNNALGNIGILDVEVEYSATLFSFMADLTAEFEAKYIAMLDSVLALNKPTTVCTIYYPRMEHEFVQKISVAALASYNDVILKQAILRGLPVIDLRLVCNEDTDYANSIEPSEAGGEKIARTIIRVVNEHDFENGRTEVFF